MIKVHFIDKMGTDLTAVNAARISFAGESQELNERDLKLIDYLAKHEHMSPFEHCAMTVMVECPLFIRSQIHRHRTFAYNEVSRRYTDDGLEFYVPPVDDIRTQSKSNKQASDGPIPEGDARNAETLIRQAHAYSLEFYNQLIALGVAREQARGVLPQNLMTKFYQTGNLRNFAHFVRLRDHGHAQKEAQYIAREIKRIMLEHFPNAAAALFKHQRQP
jgi:thymidylate synthase (FAD)